MNAHGTLRSMLVSVSLHPHPGASLWRGQWASWGGRALTARPLCNPPRRPKRVSIQTASFLLPSSPLHGALPARLVALAPLSGGTRAAAGRGTARCGRRARKRPFAGTPGRFNSPRVRSPPASFATASAKWRARVTRARRPGREGAALAAPLLPPQQQIRTLT